MSEFSIDLSPIVNLINRLSGQLSDNMNEVNNNIGIVNDNVNMVRRETMEKISMLKAELQEKLDFMMKTQKFQAALQAAITEVIRVRQELEQKFGTQKLVRDSMLGILQAADLSLVTESTISKCTEELMISAPKYWLAPCLIALAAWISNNESLAKRAVEEACKRDLEKTCLLFALISRRVSAGRMQAGKPTSNVAFEWLGEYFKEQNPQKMSLNIIAYIDAYSNGIFGEDKDNICQEHIYHWMDDLKASNPNFAKEKISYWENVFEAYCNTQLDNNYAALRAVCQKDQFAGMISYLSRIDASERENADEKYTGIKSYIKSVMEAPVDTEQLIKDIDEQLIKLVNEYEEDEVGLREEEERLNYIKQFEGDVEKADAWLNAIRRRENARNAPVDFADRLSKSIVDKSSSRVSAKKTAFVLMEPYIKQAFNSFITKNKAAYPNEVNLKIEDAGKSYNSSIEGVGLIAAQKKLVWTGKTTNSGNRKELTESLQKEFNKAKEAQIATVSDEPALKKKKMGLIWTCTIIGALFGIPMMLKSKRMLAENEQTRSNIATYYDKASKDATALLSKALDQRYAANQIVEKFGANKENETINI